MMPSPDQLFEALHATWPAAAQTKWDGWIIRDGAGAGKRASAASLVTPNADITQAEALQRDLGQTPLFMIRQSDGQDQTILDEALHNRGYATLDPTVIYACDVDSLAPDTLPIAKTYAVWEPLQVMKEIWAVGGIGAARTALMHRVTGPKTAIMSRTGDTACGVGFVALHKNIAMVHAVEVHKTHRRKGVARLVMANAAHWAKAQGAKTLALAVTRDNLAANMLYTSLGMTQVTAYHYRAKDV